MHETCSIFKSHVCETYQSWYISSWFAVLYIIPLHTIPLLYSFLGGGYLWSLPWPKILENTCSWCAKSNISLWPKDPWWAQTPSPLQAIHEVKNIFLITQRHVSRVHCIVSCTDDIKATVGKAAGALHRSRQWHRAVLMVLAFFTTAHWGF